jgi:signal recognition particle receptor subunit beta
MFIVILALSVFDQVIGPIILFSSDDANIGKYRNQILRLMDISNDEGFFEFNFTDLQLHSLNYRFTLYSEWGRGHIEYMMISLVTSTSNQTLIFKPVIENFVKEIKADPKFFKALYLKEKQIDPEITEYHKKLHEQFAKCVNDAKSCFMQGLLGHIAFFGLYRVGKTSLINRITTGKYDLNVRPTLGVQIIKFMIENYSLFAYDVGGQTHLKSLWDQIRVKPKAIVYVIDSAFTEAQLKEARLHFDEVITHFIFDKTNKQSYSFPLLILANKKDLNPAISEAKIKQILQPERYDLKMNIGVVSALTNEGVIENIRWLVQQLMFCE